MPGLSCSKKKINGKEDIYSEYIKVFTGAVDFDEFIDKYQFTHLLVCDGKSLSGYLTASNDFEMVVDGNGYCLFERCQTLGQ